MSAPDEPKRGISRLLNITVNLTALSVMAVALLHPKGLVVTSFRQSRDRAHERDTIAVVWNELSGNDGQQNPPTKQRC